MKSALGYVGAITSRYSAIAVQFFLVILISRKLSPSEAGNYFALFGFIATAFTAAGIGAPDGLVRQVGVMLAGGRSMEVDGAIRGCFKWSMLSTLVLQIVGAIALYLLGYDLIFLIQASVWLYSYCTIFVSSQAIVALNRPGLGSFFAYSAVNIAYLFTSVPYLLFAEIPTLTTVLAVSSSSSAFIAVCAVLVAQTGTRKGAVASVDNSIFTMVTTGFPIASARFVQASLAWIPVWVIIYILGPSEAAVYGAAARLLVGATAIIASLRFAVRPAIVRLAEKGEWKMIEALSRTISFVAFVPTVCATALVHFFGPKVLLALLGASYRDASPILTILLIGALAEAVGGPVDEVLKMTGKATLVLKTLSTAAVIEFALSIALSPLGINYVAFAPVAAFSFLYLVLIVLLRNQRGITIFPSATPLLEYRKRKVCE